MAVADLEDSVKRLRTYRGRTGGSPAKANGESLVRSATAGAPMFVDAWVCDREGRAVAGARVDLTPLEFKQQHHPIPNRAVLQE